MTHWFPPFDDGAPGGGLHEVPPPSTAAEYLAATVAQAGTVGAPSVTMASLQPSVKPVGKGLAWAPALCSYGWGIDAMVVDDATGHPSGLVIPVYVWFSDQVSNPGASPPDWQQFSGPGPVVLGQPYLRFTPSGNDVHLVCLSRGHAVWAADSFLFDVPTQQILFHVPGLGAPLGIMIVTFHLTGEFGFL